MFKVGDLVVVKNVHKKFEDYYSDGAVGVIKSLINDSALVEFRRGTYTRNRMDKPYQMWSVPQHSLELYTEQKPTLRVIFEGVDGSGKSTIAKKVAERYGLSYIHLSGSDAQDYDFYHNLMRKRNVVFDRQFFSQVIYDEYLNENRSVLSDKDCDNLLQDVKDYKYLVFIMDRDIIDVENTIIENNEVKEIQNNAKDIASHYRVIAKVQGYEIISVDDTSDEKVFKVIDDFMEFYHI